MTPLVRDAWLEGLLQDARYAARLWRNNTAFALAAVLILAVGISASAVTVSAVKGILFRPLPFANADRLVWIFSENVAQGVSAERTSSAELSVLQERSRSFSRLASINGWSLILNEGMTPESLHGLAVRPELFDVLGVEPALGRRLFPADADDPDAHVMLISHELWQRRFGGAPDLIGRSVRIGLESRGTIVGVLPAGLEFPLARSPQAGNGSELVAGSQDFWLAQRPTAASDRTQRWQTTLGLLRPGISLVEAQAELKQIGRQLSIEDPKANGGWGLTAASMREQIVGRTGPVLTLLLGAVGVVLLLVCTNVATLLLCRGSMRRSELAVRAALGASRGRILRQLLLEGSMLSVLGSATGALLATWELKLLVAFGPTDVPFLRELTVDSTLVGGAIGFAMVTGVLAAAAPAWSLSHADPRQALRERTGATDPSRTSALRNTLVIVQIAMTVVLLSAAALLLRSFVRLANVDLGYEPRPVLTAELYAWDQSGTAPDLRGRLFDRLKELPWVAAAGAVHSVPLTGKWVIRDRFRIAGGTASTTDGLSASLTFVGFDYFEAMGVPLRQGRGFNRAESLDTENAPVAIVNESFARRFFPGGDALGATLFAPGAHARRIVGVVKDTRDTRPDLPTEPQFYLPLVLDDLKLVVRTAGDPGEFTTALRREIAALDPRVLVTAVMPMDEIVKGTREERRFALAVLTAFAGIALLLGSAGLYATLAYAVVLRKKEIGIRLALGAQVRDVVGMIVGQGMKHFAAGLLLGVIASFALRRLLESQLFELSVTDPWSHVAAAVLLVLCALGACAIPARRAGAIDPIAALRVE